MPNKKNNTVIMVIYLIEQEYNDRSYLVRPRLSILEIFLHPYNLCHAGSPRIYCIYEPMPRCLIPSYPVPSAIFITHTSDSELNCIRNAHGAMCGPSERSQNYPMILLFSFFFFRTFWFSTIAGISHVFLDLQINAIFSVATMALDLGCFIFSEGDTSVTRM